MVFIYINRQSSIISNSQICLVCCRITNIITRVYHLLFSEFRMKRVSSRGICMETVCSSTESKHFIMRAHKHHPYNKGKRHSRSWCQIYIPLDTRMRRNVTRITYNAQKRLARNNIIGVVDDFLNTRTVLTAVASEAGLTFTFESIRQLNAPSVVVARLGETG